MAFTAVNGPYSIGVRLGEQTETLQIPYGHTDPEEQEAAAVAVAGIIEDLTEGVPTTIGRRLQYDAAAVALIPDDSKVRIPSMGFNFIDSNGDRRRVFVPWCQLDASEKETAGTAMATAMSGDALTYTFLS